MWGVAAALMAGVWLGVLWPLLLLLVLLCWQWWRGKNRRYLLVLILAYGYAAWQLQQGLAERLPESLHGETLWFQAQVVDIPRSDTVTRFSRLQRRQRYTLLVWGNPAWPGEHRLQVSSYSPLTSVSAADQLTVLLRLQFPHARYNEGSSDFQRLWLANGIAARATVQQLSVDAPGRGWLARRAEISGRVQQHTALTASGWQILPALLVGDRSAVDEPLWRLFQSTGTAHLLAISGLHVAMVAGWLWWLGRWLLMPLLATLLPVLRRWTLPQLAWLPALLGATSYAAMAGFSLPTCRALIMLTLVALAQCWRRPLSLSVSLAAALLAVLLLDPLSALSASLWLSFSAVAFIALLSRQQSRRWLVLLLPLLMGWVSVLLFDQWAWSAPLANLLLIPLYTLLIIPLLLLGALLDWSGGLLVAAIAVDASVALMERLAAGSQSWQGWPPTVFAGVCALLVLLLLLLPAVPFPRRLLPLLLLPWLSQRPPPLADGDIELVAFDVGQGLAMAVRTRNHLLFYDTGPGWADGSVAEQVIMPWLRRYRLQPDLLMISHGDNDHAGGVAAFDRRIPRYSGEPVRVVPSQPCRAGQQWQWDGVTFTVLWPRSSLHWHGNNASCVLWIAGSQGSLLLTGDIEKAVEYRLLPQLPAVDLLQLPHHGSATSSTAALLKMTEPGWALASAGYGNHLGHPADSVLQRLAAEDITVMRTDHHGMIVFRWGGTDNAPLITKWRQQHGGPWHGQAGWRLW